MIHAAIIRRNIVIIEKEALLYYNISVTESMFVFLSTCMEYIYIS